jgi:hypothetical protein
MKLITFNNRPQTHPEKHHDDSEGSSDDSSSDDSSSDDEDEPKRKHSTCHSKHKCHGKGCCHSKFEVYIKTKTHDVFLTEGDRSDESCHNDCNPKPSKALGSFYRKPQFKHSSPNSSSTQVSRAWPVHAICSKLCASSFYRSFGFWKLFHCDCEPQHTTPLHYHCEGKHCITFTTTSTSTFTRYHPHSCPPPSKPSICKGYQCNTLTATLTSASCHIHQPTSTYCKGSHCKIRTDHITRTSYPNHKVKSIETFDRCRGLKCSTSTSTSTATSCYTNKPTDVMCKSESCKTLHKPTWLPKSLPRPISEWEPDCTATTFGSSGHGHTSKTVYCPPPAPSITVPKPSISHDYHKPPVSHYRPESPHHHFKPPPSYLPKPPVSHYKPVLCSTDCYTAQKKPTSGTSNSAVQLAPASSTSQNPHVYSKTGSKFPRSFDPSNSIDIFIATAPKPMDNSASGVHAGGLILIIAIFFSLVI